ncbi:uncharacterized protein LOC124474499 isoform X2 [Hypomesus transpacificus]|uniref:uncharacterized protein LOC124474499 isoform X2 n=1 Tax=Hypomesus transpacificus TaxID=137520 RepID=UPI001F07F255|nr:uncharacterized protein LOC124474499 isoform X2 [Hypomesus transpacificus]
MWKSAFRFVVLLGLQGMYTAIEETLYFVLSEMSNSTPICTYPSFEEMLAVNCEIHTVNNLTYGCAIAYRFDINKIHTSCVSRVTMHVEKERTFLHFIHPTASDEGNYKCQCIFHGGTNFTNISVSYKESHASMTEEGPYYPNVTVMMGGLAVTMVAVVLVGVTLKKIHLWKLHQQNCVPSTEFQVKHDVFMSSRGARY